MMSPRISIRLLAAQSDERLLALASQGHERAFEALVHRYRRPLLRYCRRMGLSDARAEDVLQHALTQTWLAMAGETEIREIKPWLYRVVHNAAVNSIRRAGEDHAPLSDALAVPAPAAESELDRTIAMRDALTGVAALPQMQRQAIVLTAIEGHSHEEVASAMGISHGAVRGLLYRARAALRGAAAAITPAPLLNWACGGASRLAPTATRLAELSGSGGGEFGGVLLKGAAVAVTAALAAGAVLLPLHRHGGHASKVATLSPAPVTAAAASDGSSPAGTSPAAGARSGPAAGSGRAAANAVPGAAITLRSAPAPSGSEPGASPVSQPAPSAGGGSTVPGQTVTVTSAVLGTSAANGHVGEAGASGSSGAGSKGTSGAGSGGSEQKGVAEAPGGRGSEGAGGKEDDGKEDDGKEDDGGKEGGAGKEDDGSGSERSQSEHERAEHEAEEAQERREREAEAAREHREHEAESEQEAAKGKDN